MGFVHNCFSSKQKNKVYSIGLLHFILICSGICSLVTEMINYEEPVTDYEEVYIGLHYTVHLILISCLVIGTYTDISYFLLPWICAAFLPFAMLTLLALTSTGSTTFLVCILDWAYVVVCWYCWVIVCLHFLESHNRTTAIYKKTAS